MSFLAILISTVLVLILVKFLNWFLSYRDRIKKWKQFPGPNALPLIGNSEGFRNAKDLLPNAIECQKQYGLTYRVQLGLNNFLITADPRLNEIVATSHTLLQKSLAIKFLKVWLGSGMITSENPTWRIHRRLITPTFHFKILEDFVPTFNKNVKHLVDVFKANRLNKRFDAYEDILLCSLDAICETAMGVSIHALRDRNQPDYVESIKSLGRLSIERSLSSWKQYHFLFGMSAEREQEVKMMNHIQKLTNYMIETRKAALFNKNAPDINDNSETKKRVAFLDHLLLAIDKNDKLMSKQELEEEVTTFLFAGHDTVASATSFALYYLAMHPDMQQRAHEEILEVYGSETELTFDKLAELKYLDAVIKETLRLCPSVPIHSRVMTKDLPFDGKIIPKGVHVVLFPYGSHRNEKLFPNPEQFDPDRFLDKNYAKEVLFGYLPFNAGPRNCIGQKYAMIAMKCFMGELLKEFKFTKDEHFKIQPVAEGVLKSMNGVWLTIEKRD